ncbi:MAG: MATE family efflux transporter, partial [Oscillospiraceae bacterium]|nr:MATE family efflux transporter [Oscillospiraceae bacterium]
FVGQNLGVNKVERARKGANTALAIAFLTCGIISVPIVAFAPHIVVFFNSKPEVVAYGTLLLQVITPIHIVSCVNQVYSGALRGAGNSRAPMVMMLMSFVLFRQIYMFIMSNFIMNEYLPIALGYPAGWAVCSILIFIYYKRTNLSLTRIVED